MTSDVFFLSLALIEISFYQRLLEYTICGFQGTYRFFSEANGDGEIRTLDPLLARQVLSQLSYTPTDFSDGLKWTRTTDLTLIRRAL